MRPNTKQVGDETEATYLSALIAGGYSVAIPFGDNDRYDLLVDTGAELLRVQCKTGWMEDGCIRFKTHSKTTVDGEVTLTGYDGEVDVFAVRCKDDGALYWVPQEEASTRNTYLRVDDPEIDHPAVRLADEYRFENTLPE